MYCEKCGKEVIAEICKAEISDHRDMTVTVKVDLKGFCKLCRNTTFGERTERVTFKEKAP